MDLLTSFLSRELFSISVRAFTLVGIRERSSVCLGTKIPASAPQISVEKTRVPEVGFGARDNFRLNIFYILYSSMIIGRTGGRNLQNFQRGECSSIAL